MDDPEPREPEPQPKKKRKKRKGKTAPLPLALEAETPPSMARQPASSGSRWLAVPLSIVSLLVGVWRLSRTSACNSPSSSSQAAPGRDIVRQPPPRLADAYQCGVECERACASTKDSMMQMTCSRMCVDDCPIDASTPTPKTGVPECDAYLSTWAQCRPTDKKEIMRMAWRVGASLPLPENLTKIIEVCTKSGQAMSKICGGSDVSSSASASASASPSGAPSAASSAKAGGPATPRKP